MSRAFKLPDLGEGIHEAEIVAILVKVGDPVQEGQPFMEVETDKARVEIPSPFTGTVEEIAVKQDDTVKVGDVLIVFGDGDRKTAPPAENTGEAIARAALAEEKTSQGGATPPPQPAGRAAEADGGTEPPPQASTEEREGPVPASPATRRLAREMGVNLREVPASGPAGLVTAADVRDFAERALRGGGPGIPADAGTVEAAEGEPATETAPTRESAAPSTLPDFGRWGAVERVPLRSVRRATARHMALAWAQIPHVNHQDVADVTRLEAFRKEHKAEVEAEGGQLTTTIFVMKAVVAALKSHSRFNCSLDAGSEEIVLKHYYHLGVAVDTERGLVVPVVRDVDRKSILELSVELKQAAERARAGNSTLEEMQGGTFTITNIGALGGTGFAPIVNYPEVAILGMGKARLQPVVLGDEREYEIVPRLMMPLILAFDHRVLDGADAARFMRMVVESLESPDKLWLRI